MSTVLNYNPALSGASNASEWLNAPHSTGVSKSRF